MACAVNQIGFAGAQAVAEKLGSVPGLTTLNFGGVEHAGAEGERADQGCWPRVGGGKCMVRGVGGGEWCGGTLDHAAAGCAAKQWQQVKHAAMHMHG